MKIIWLIPVLCILIVSCRNNEEIVSEVTTDLEEIQPSLSSIQPLEGIEILPNHYRIDGSEKDTLFLENGGTVLFDELSFVDKDGNIVNGEVDVEWQEFHTLGDILRSGIPMKYDSAGVEYDLVSGGMFTIHATHNNESVEIAPGKTAKVNLVSMDDTPCFNFYKLDEKTGDWSYKTTKEGETIEDEKKSEKTQEASILDVELDVHAYPELVNENIIGWQMAELLPKKECNRLKANIEKARLIEIDSLFWYGLEVNYETGAEIYPIQPYTMEEAMNDSRNNELELAEEFEEIKEYQKQLAAGKVVRSIEISNFGTFNWDIVNKRKNSKRLVADFEFPEQTRPELISLFLVSPDENAIISFDPKGDKLFSFDPTKRNCLVAILPGNELVIVSDKGFDLARTAKPRTVHTFNFKTTGVKLNSSSDIMNHIERFI